ncbi:MAG: helix-turn-helix domain-containing protein [Bacteroidaceae bacterium]|nr:helix-turn-helix domain-containing protein [Bacteroidaceae bacterium]
MRQKKAGQIQEVEKLWLTTEEVMKYLGCSPDFLKKIREKGEVTYAQYGSKAVWYLKASIDQFLSKHIVGERPASLMPSTYATASTRI